MHAATQEQDQRSKQLSIAAWSGFSSGREDDLELLMPILYSAGTDRHRERERERKTATEAKPARKYKLTGRESRGQMRHVTTRNHIPKIVRYIAI